MTASRRATRGLLRAAAGWVALALVAGGCAATRAPAVAVSHEVGYSPYDSERVRTALCDLY